MDDSLPTDGRRRVEIENVRPRVDDGQFPIKRIVHDPVTVEADILVDGHDVLIPILRFRANDKSPWLEARMESRYNDLYAAPLVIDRIGRWQFCVIAWIDHFATWRYELTKRAAAGQDLTVEFLVGANLAESAAKRATEKHASAEAGTLQSITAQLRDTNLSSDQRTEIALNQSLEQLMFRFADRSLATESEIYEIVVDRPRARFSTWYELFPRSCGANAETHGTLRDVQAKLPQIAEMGFDILYMPPIHPVGDAFRKGKNNNEKAQPGDVGSPWGIGNKDGGHKAIHSQLGTIEDFHSLRTAAEKLGIELALDIAFQCSPDHPYAKDHKNWFRNKPDGSIQYAENPPKKYQDIYPFDFETTAWPQLWNELKSVFDYWIEQGVRVFRVDNPHTKPFAFWQWTITNIKHEHPDVLFLSEAFTRPKIMYRLAKLGFSQSYTYFTWRTEKKEMTEYFTELSHAPVNQFFRPNYWPNTPDILHGFLQNGGRPAFVTRFVLAAMLGANYGMYGPAYELCDNAPREPGSEEYLNSEKYEIKAWDWDRADSFRGLITKVNQIRREYPAAQRDDSLQFHAIDNDHIIAFSKHGAEGEGGLLTISSLDPTTMHQAWFEFNANTVPCNPPYNGSLSDLLTGQIYKIEEGRIFVELTPERPVCVLKL